MLVHIVEIWFEMLVHLQVWHNGKQLFCCFLLFHICLNAPQYDNSLFSFTLCTSVLLFHIDVVLTFLSKLLFTWQWLSNFQKIFQVSGHFGGLVGVLLLWMLLFSRWWNFSTTLIVKYINLMVWIDKFDVFNLIEVCIGHLIICLLFCVSISLKALLLLYVPPWMILPLVIPFEYWIRTPLYHAWILY